MAPPSLPEAIAIIESAPGHHDEAIGYGGIESDTYRAYRVVRDAASRAQLERLARHDNPVARLYAIDALVARAEPFDLGAYVLAHLDDTEELETMRGCIGGRRPFADVLLDEHADRLEAATRARIQEWLVENRTSLSYRQRVLLHEEPRPSQRGRLRELVPEEPAALVALARLGEEQDLAFIEQHFEAAPHFALWAAAVRPDPRFLPHIRTLHARLRDDRATPLLRRLYATAVRHPVADCAELLADPLTRELPGNRRQRHIDAAYRALVDPVRPEFTELYFRYWQEAGRLTGEVLTLLETTAPERTIRVAVETLAGDASPPLPGRLLTLAARSPAPGDAAALSAALARGIRAANVHSFPAYASHDLVAGDPEAQQLLLERFGSASNPHIYLAAARALLAIDAARWLPELEAVVATRPELTKDWGGQRLRELLAQARERN